MDALLPPWQGGSALNRILVRSPEQILQKGISVENLGGTQREGETPASDFKL